MRTTITRWATALLSCLLIVIAAIPFCGAAQQVRDAQAHGAKGKELLARGDLPAAEQELRRAVAMSPDDAEFLGLLGVALGMQRKLRDSDVYLEKALRLETADSVTRRNLAWNQFELGDLSVARTNLARVLKERSAVAISA